MKKLISFLSISFLFLFFTACSSVDSDAQKAAELNKKSLEYIKDQNLEEAEKVYKESQEIAARYKNTEKYEEFNTAYNKYMMGETPQD